VRWLYQNGRGFTARTHVHTLPTTPLTTYRAADCAGRAVLDHGFAGMVSMATGAPGVDAEKVDAVARASAGLPEGHPVACATTGRPYRAGAPMIFRRREPEALRIFSTASADG
jgi:hypothetical protein